MKFGIALNNLPFTPDAKQVIYVENHFDEKVNAFIKDNYDALVAKFRIHGLDFVYLPLYFNSEDIEAKVRYYAPYLVSQIKSDVYAIDVSTLKAKVVLDANPIDICHIPFFGNFIMVVR